MTEENKPTIPKRSALVIRTADGQRLKPGCPVCDAVSWSEPSPKQKDGKEIEGFQPALTAIDGDGNILALPARTYICQNCGFVWHFALNVNREYEVESGDDK